MLKIVFFTYTGYVAQFWHLVAIIGNFTKTFQAKLPNVKISRNKHFRCMWVQLAWASMWWSRVLDTAIFFPSDFSSTSDYDLWLLFLFVFVSLVFKHCACVWKHVLISKVHKHIQHHKWMAHNRVHDDDMDDGDDDEKMFHYVCALPIYCIYVIIFALYVFESQQVTRVSSLCTNNMWSTWTSLSLSHTPSACVCIVVNPTGNVD